MLLTCYSFKLLLESGIVRMVRMMWFSFVLHAVYLGLVSNSNDG